MEMFTFFKDAVLIFVAVTGSIVAVKGLGTWQRQLRGQSEYELSRRILVTLFKYRDAIYGVRNSVMWGNELPVPTEDELKSMSSGEVRFYGFSKAYQARWDKVQEQRTLLYADLLEAEVIWGEALNNRFKTIIDLQHELFVKVRHHLELINPNTPERTKEAILNIDKNDRDILYDDPGEEADDYKTDLIQAIKFIENYLKPKLRHK